MTRFQRSITFPSIVVLFGLALPAPGLAQRLLYDSGRDEQGKAALTAAGDVASDPVFAALSKNVEEAGKQQLETIMRWQEVRLRAAINTFSLWSDVSDRLDDVDKLLTPSLDTAAEQGLLAARLVELQKRAEALRAEIAEFQAATKDESDAFHEALSHLGEAKQVVDFASQLPGANPAKIQAINELITAVGQVQKVYDSVRGIFKAAAAVKAPIASMGPSAQQIQLSLLRVEEDHLKRLGIIRARQALEVGAIKQMVDAARLYVSHVTKTEDPKARIETTLGKFNVPASRDQLEFALLALYTSAAVVAQNDTAASLANLRLTLEERRASIERSAVGAGVSEQRVREAARRLAAYWQSGLRPKDVAELIYHLSTAISLPIIASK